MRNINDKVWVPKAHLTNVEALCPDCIGTARWHCVLPSGEEFDVECPRCYPGGYDRSTGKIHEEWQFVADAVETTITGISIVKQGFEYSTIAGRFDDIDVCDTKEQALARCQVKTQEYVDNENAALKKRAQSKGRPRKGPNGEREASDDFGGRSIVYARSVIRTSLKEAIRWANFAERHGVKQDLQAMLQEQLKKG